MMIATAWTRIATAAATRIRALFNSRNYTQLLAENPAGSLTDPGLILLRARAAGLRAREVAATVAEAVKVLAPEAPVNGVTLRGFATYPKIAPFAGSGPVMNVVTRAISTKSSRSATSRSPRPAIDPGPDSGSPRRSPGHAWFESPVSPMPPDSQEPVVLLTSPE